MLGRIRRRLGSSATERSVTEALSERDASRKKEEEEEAAELAKYELSNVGSPDQAYAQMDKGYFEPSFDPVKHLLARLPGKAHHVPMFIMKEQVTCDLARDAVQQRLSREVLANLNEFVEGMKHVQDVDLDITRATIHVSNSLRKLKEAREGLVKLCRWRRRRERMAAVRERVAWLRRVVTAEDDARELLRARDYVRAVALCVHTVQQLSTPDARQFHVLATGPRRRMLNMLPAVRHLLDETLGQLIHDFTTQEYSATVRAYLILDAATAEEAAADEAEAAFLGGAATSASMSDALLVSGATAELPSMVQARLVAAVDKATQDAVVSALLSTLDTDGADSRAGSFFGDLLPGSEARDAAERAALQQLSFPALCARLKPDQLVPALLAAFERIFGLLHQHYLICQWHRLPFDRRNVDTAFLHRCAVDADDPAPPLVPTASEGSGAGAGVDADVDGDDDGLEPPGHAPRLKSQNLTEVEGKARDAAVARTVERLHDPRRERAVLDYVRRGLMEDRKVVWHHTQKRVGALVNTACQSLGTQLPVEAVVALMQLTDRFLAIGEEYSGSDSTVLRASLRRLCVEYLDRLEESATESLMSLLRAESWKRMRVNLEKLGGTEGVVARAAGSGPGSGPTAAAGAAQAAVNRVVAWAGEVSEEKGTFASVPKLGNPFGAARRRLPDDEDSDAGSDSDSDEVVDVDASEFDEDEEDGPGSRSQRREDRFGTPWIISMSALNGFASSCGKLLGLATALPLVAPDSYAAITRMFDTYVYTVATQFLPVAAVSALDKARAVVMDPTEFDYLFPGALQLCKAVVTAHPGPLDAPPPAAGDESGKGGAGAGAGAGADAAAASRASSFTDESKTALDDGSDSLASTSRGGAFRAISALLNRVRGAHEASRTADAVCNLDLSMSHSLYGMEARCVAVESMDFLLDVLRVLAPKLQALLPAASRGELASFYKRSRDIVHRVRSYMYHSMSALLFAEASTVPVWVSSVKWDSVKESSTHSDYVVKILEALKKLTKRMGKLTATGEVPDRVRRHVYACCVSHLYERFVEGVGRVRKCSTAGRGQMAMDITFINMKVQEIHSLPDGMPHDKRWVDEYVQAFYFTAPSDVMDWVLHHKDAYALRLARALVTHGVGSSMKKRKVKELVAQVEAVYGIVPS